MRTTVCILLAALLVPLVAGCASGGSAAPAASRGTIEHVVLVKLKDPALAPQLIADGEALRRISGVVRYVCGRPVDTGRASVDAGYDVGLSISFSTAAAYEGYVTDPRHTGLVEKWRPRWEWLRVHDFGGLAR